jgi:plastocyanin
VSFSCGCIFFEREVSVRKLWAVAGIALMAAACSKSSTETVASPPPSAEASAMPAASAMAAPVQLTGKVNNHGSKALGMATSLSLEQDSYYFEPTFIKPEAGSHLTVTLKNASKVEHNFSITSLNIDKDVAAGKTETVTVNLPTGTAPVAFFCKYHKSLGMQGAFYFQ